MKEKKVTVGLLWTPQAETTFLHGSTCVVWEGELYTYGGLGEYGEFVDSITRWSGRGENREVTPQNKNMKTDVPGDTHGDDERGLHVCFRRSREIRRDERPLGV